MASWRNQSILSILPSLIAPFLFFSTFSFVFTLTDSSQWTAGGETKGKNDCVYQLTLKLPLICSQFEKVEDSRNIWDAIYSLKITLRPKKHILGSWFVLCMNTGKMWHRFAGTNGFKPFSCANGWSVQTFFFRRLGTVMKLSQHTSRSWKELGRCV